jgi:hypothetical protein
MIPLSPPMERTWRDIREVFSLIGLHGNSGLRAPAQAATEVNHQRIGPSDGSFMIFGVPVTSMPPKGLSVPLLVPPPRPEVAGAVTFPPAGGVGRVGAVARGTPAGAPVVGTLWDGVLDDCPGVRSGAGPVPLGMGLPGAVVPPDGGAAPAPVVPPVTEEGAIPGLAVVPDGEAAPVPAAPPVVPAPPAAPAAPPPAAPPPAPPAPPPALPPPPPPPPPSASARGMLSARTMAATPACKGSERMGRSLVGDG